MLACLLRRTYDPARLLAQHPPKLKHAHKRLVFELAGATGGPPIELTRWAAAVLPEAVDLASTEVVPSPGYYAYDGGDGEWHVNFADPQLFVAYGSPLLAQDELQAAEIPLLGSIREALLAEKVAALTEEAGQATPVLVAGAERRCAIETAPDLAAGRPYGLYGNQFARAEAEVVKRATRILAPPTRTNLICIAAPMGRSGPYWRTDLERILVTAYTGFSAAVLESRRRWPHAPVEVRTGFWGCGAFGGNRRAMTLLQILAARMAGVDRLRFYAFDDAGARAFADGAASARAVAEGTRNVATILERIDDLDYEWGVSDGT